MAGVPSSGGNLRQSLLHHAVALAREGGPGAVTIRDVQRRAGVSHSAAYRHYADRDALLAAVSQTALTLLAAHMREGVDPGASPAQRLRALGRGYVGFARAEPGLFATIGLARDPGMDAAPHSDDTSPSRLLSDCLDDMTATGELAAQRRDFADVAVWSAVHGFAVLVLTGPLTALRDGDVEAARERLLDTVVAGLTDPGRVGRRSPPG